MMVILGNDLANAIQAERRQRAARARPGHESIRPVSEQAPLFSLYCRATAWLRTRVAVLSPGVSGGR
jgi:hypothetical protein